MENIQSVVQKAMKKKFGEYGTLTSDDMQAMAHIPYGISAQCLSLDLIIGRPGLPAGRLTEICAPEGNAKSMHGYHLLAETQRRKGLGILIETEQAFEAERLKSLGIIPEDLLVSQPQHLEEAFSMIESQILLIRETAKFPGPLTIVFDSIAGTPSASETEKGYDERGMASGARAISQAMRKLIMIIARHKVVLVFLNQLRSTMNPYGEKFVSYGGMAIKYHSSLRLQFSSRNSERIVDKEGNNVGLKMRARTIKNKLNIPFLQTSYDIFYRTGIDPYIDLLYAGLKIGYIEGSRGHFRIGDRTFTTAEWPVVVEELRGPHKLRERLTKLAIARDFLKPYSPHHVEKESV